MGHHLLRYTVAANYLEHRPAFRAVHLAHADAAVARVELLPGGAVDAIPMVEALLLFSADAPQVAEDFARADPYVANGLVTAWRVDRWRTVVGTQAETVQP